MATLAFETDLKNHELRLDPQDADAIEKIVSWEIEPSFAKPGRTAWYRLRTPIRSANGGPLLLAAKLKGVGAWNPSDPRVPSGIKGAHPVGTMPPSVAEYEETARTVHFGIDSNGMFKGVRSEPAPFGSILLRRARQEYENALTLCAARVPSIVPYALYRYRDAEFNGEQIGAVVSLAPDESPYALDFLYLSADDAEDQRRTHGRDVLRALDFADCDERAVVAAQRTIGRQIGETLRKFAQAGLYRYSSAWDNFYFDKRDAQVYLTDLDSTRRLEELKGDSAGLQVLRDLAGALWRLPKQYSERDAVPRFRLGQILDVDPLAATVAGYFDVSEDRASEIVRPLWDYAIPHWYLLKRQGAEIANFSKDKRKTYRLDKSMFHCLAILAVSDIYRETHSAMGLPPIPDRAQLMERIDLFLGEQMEYIRWIVRDERFCVP